MEQVFSSLHPKYWRTQREVALWSGMTSETVSIYLRCLEAADRLEISKYWKQTEKQVRLSRQVGKPVGNWIYQYKPKAQDEVGS